MPSSIFAKRTRSQINISDLSLQSLTLARSPLKDARRALRDRQAILNSDLGLNLTAQDMPPDISEDEILLSPRKKRPSSPLSKESLQGDGEREAKKARHDVPLGDNENRSHGSRRRQVKTRDRSATVIASKKPYSFAAPPNTVVTTPGRQRAQSVPPPSSSFPTIPHLDLLTPLRSPSKRPEPKLRYASVPLLDTIPDDGKDKQDTAMYIDPVQRPPNIVFAPSVAMALVTPKRDPPLEDQGSPLSPLTPLPPTPFPPKAEAAVSNRKSIATFDQKFKPLGLVSTSNSENRPAPSNEAAAPAHSRLPRLSSILMPPPSAVPAPKKSTVASKMKPKTKPKPSTGGRITRSTTLKQKELALASPKTPSIEKRKSIGSSLSFSFAAPTLSSKSKGKEKELPLKPGSPSRIAIATASSKLNLPISRPPTASSSSALSTTSSTAPEASSDAPLPRPPIAQIDMKSRPGALSSLSMALEKLNLPRPERPGTSLGFREEGRVAKMRDDKPRVADDGRVGMSRSSGIGIGLGRPSNAPKKSGAMPTTTTSNAATGQPKRLPFFPTAKPVAGRINLNSGVVVGNNRFGMPHRGKVSRKTSLPSVAASPVKGGGPTTHEDGAETDTEMTGIEGDKEKEKEVDEETTNIKADIWKGKIGGRASLASHALSQSLNSIPHSGPSKGGALRSTSSHYPSSLAAGLRSAPGALGGKSRGGEGGHVSSTSNSAAKTNASDNMDKVLKDCVIFVDVRTDGGDDAGGLFVDMLRGMGAKILTRVGQTCTHIVYKNGLMSTLTRYRLMNEPRPHVVGIAWVVECVEQKCKVDESKFSVDLEGVNVAGTNKRRRSMLPKQLPDSHSPASLSSQDNEDASMRSAKEASSMLMDRDERTTSKKEKDIDSLPPLERARRRRSVLPVR